MVVSVPLVICYVVFFIDAKQLELGNLVMHTGSQGHNIACMDYSVIVMIKFYQIYYNIRFL